MISFFPGARFPGKKRTQLPRDGPLKWYDPIEHDRQQEKAREGGLPHLNLETQVNGRVV
jgi:hypothetical protein